jgi:hypothetical protein
LEFFPLFVTIFCAELRHKRISTAHERSEQAKQSGVGLLEEPFFLTNKNKKFYIKNGVNCLQLAAFGCSDRNRTNFNKFYGRFEEIGLLLVTPVFEWLYKFGLDVLLGIDRKSYLITRKSY